jgi:hypothetical protein
MREKRGQDNMTMKQRCAYMVMVGGILLFEGVALQAQLGSGSSPIGQGGPAITVPGGGAMQEGTGRSGAGTRQQDAESSGKMGSEAAIIMQPKPSEEAPGSGRPPDRSTINPGGNGGSGSGSGSGSIGSSGGTGSGSSGGMGSSGAGGGSR